MKKVLVLLTSAILTFTGCQKNEAVQQPQSNGGDENVTFTVALPDNMTKAVADDDGHAAKINHWIMEVRDSDGDVYNRQEKDGDEGVKTQTFDVTLIKGQVYDVLFWADTKGTYNTADLKDVKLLDAESAGYAANLDSRDAFSAVESGFTTTTTTSKNITLRRPFAQLNVIFTDLDKLYTTIGSATEYAKFKPTDFLATAKLPTSFNVQTQTAGTPVTTALNITAATNYLDNYAAHASEATLFMDYFFATASTKDIVDIDFSFVSKGTTIAHSFTSIPFQRNYRTNIKGDLMTSGATFNVTVDPEWYEPDTETKVATSLEQAQQIVEFSSAKPVIVKVAPEAITNATTDDVVTVGGKKYLQFILKTTSPDVVGFDLPEISSADASRLGTDTWLITYENNYPTQTVGVNAPSDSKIKIDAPTSHVEVTGTTYAEIVASTGDNTLVIPAGVTVKNLIVNKGGLEIHGTVEAASVVVSGTDKVYVRACEGLSQSVYDALKDYIDTPKYEGVQNGDKWDIVEQQASSFVTMGANEYFKIEDAFKEVESQEGDSVTIIVHRNLNETMSNDYFFTKSVLITTDNANGVSVNLNCAQTQSLISNGGKTLTVDTKVTITNLMQIFAGYGAADSKVIVKGQLNTMQIWAYKTGKFYIVPGAKVVCAYGDGMVKFRYDSEINVEDNVESAAAIDVTKDTPIFKSGYLSGDKDGAKVLNLKNSFTQTQRLSNEGNGSFAVNMDNAVLYTADDLQQGLNFGTTAAGNISMKNGSRIISDGPVVINQGAVSIEVGSTISAKSFYCAGSINIDATNATEDKILVISATAASTYSNVTVTGSNYEPVVENNSLYICLEKYTEVNTESALRTAISNASAGDKIKLTANITLSSALTIEKAVIINLGGNTITSGSSLDATDASKRPINIKTNGVVLKNGTINGKDVKPGYALINVHNNCTLENVVATTPGVPINVRAACTLDIKGENGKYESTGNYSETSDVDKRCYETGIFVSSNAVVNISGGTFLGRHYAATIATSGGTLNISGGTFNKGAAQTEANEGGGLAYAFLNDGSNSATGTITITGNPTIHGSFRGRFNNQAGHPGVLNISGGTFDSDCELFNFNQSYITLDGYTITANGECPDKGYSKTTGNGKRWKLTKNN